MGDAVEGKVVIVTGAGRGLGREYANRFAADGAAVVVADVLDDEVRDAAAEISAAGGRAVAAVVDVTDEQATISMARIALDAFGRIDVLVNNAGIWGDLQRASLLEVDPSYWDLVMAVNVRGALLCTRAVVPDMVERGNGRIINVSSMGAYMPSSVYGVSKLAVNQLTFALSAELGPSGITVNAVAPGSIDNAASRRQVPEAALDRLAGATHMRRLGTADDVFGMIRFLASDEAGWITGQTYLVNGGFNSRL